MVDELSHHGSKLDKSIFRFVGLHFYVNECGPIRSLAEEVEDLSEGWNDLLVIFGSCMLGVAAIEPTAYIRLAEFM
jgi:hypothetical protein